MSEIKQPKNILTTFIVIFSLFVVGITLVSVLFPALIISNFGSPANGLDAFEIGSNGSIIVLSNFIIISLGIIYYKNKLPSPLQKFISNLSNKQLLSKKITILILILILIPYTVFSAPELFLDEYVQAPDYQIFLDAKEIFPFGKTTFTEAQEQNDRYVRMILLITSIEIFQNVKIIPFLGSLALLVTTYFFTAEITKNRFAGIISLLVLLQSYTFLKFDSFAMYENFWVLFYLLSLYLIFKNFYLSSISYALSILTKAFTAIFLPLSITFVYFSNLKTRTKFYVLISYAIMFGVIITIWSLDASVYDNILRFDLEQLLIALTKTSHQIRFDLFVLVSILPLTIALIIKAKNGFHTASSILFLITGSIFAGAIVEMLSSHFVILPYRFIPTIVFFAVGIGLLFNRNQDVKL
tara:strand:+ start:91 stop:1323 length:1233 start_codon:yes stop_codon:yes gene_type:complete